MGRFTVRLPDMLHDELIEQAQNEGVSLNQYVVVLLARQTPIQGSVEVASLAEIKQQQEQFDAFREKLGPPDRAAATKYLATREVVKPSSEYEADLISRVREKFPVLAKTASLPLSDRVTEIDCGGHYEYELSEHNDEQYCWNFSDMPTHDAKR